jgi:hypothetical protein
MRLNPVCRQIKKYLFEVAVYLTHASARAARYRDERLRLMILTKVKAEVGTTPVACDKQ